VLLKNIVLRRTDKYKYYFLSLDVDLTIASSLAIYFIAKKHNIAETNGKRAVAENADPSGLEKNNHRIHP